MSEKVHEWDYTLCTVCYVRPLRMYSYWISMASMHDVQEATGFKWIKM